MAKTKISEFSTTANNNSDINSINISEGCAPSGINDAIRELMRQLKEFQTGGAGDSVNSGGDFSVATNKFTVASATGNTAVAGTLGATGDFAINTDKFTVTASSGNTAVAGTLASTGNFAVNTDKFSVTAASGNTSVAGTLGAAGNFAVNTDKFTVAASTGNTAVAGTLGVTGATTLTGALVANGNSTLGDADTDTVTLNASFVNGTTLKTAKTATNTLALAAYDVDGTAYTNLVTLTAGNTPSLALTSTAVGTINNMSIGATTASTGAFTTLSASGNVTLSGGTANGVLYLNGSKVATSGSALTFNGSTEVVLDGGSTKGRLTLVADNGPNAVLSTTTGFGAWSNFKIGALAHLWDISGSEQMRLTSTGLGIGTSSPADKLDVNGTIRIRGGNYLFLNNAANDSLSVIYNGGSTGAGNLQFNTGGAERARIDSSGNLLVGTTSTVGSAKFYVLGSVGNFISRIRNSDANPSGLEVSYTAATINGTGNDFLYCADATALRAEIRSNGGLANYQANNVNLSDRREKTNFAPAKAYLDTICAIPVQTFNYIDQNNEEDPGLTLGVVAQDVQSVAPELVMESNWGTEDNPKMRLSIYQTDLQYALMKALQELKAEFDAYKASHP